MKNTVIDILIYLFENYMDDEIDLATDRDRIRKELRDIGFDPLQVTKALDWLHELAAEPPSDTVWQQSGTGSFRMFTREEERVLDVECRSLIHFLGNIGVLDDSSREIIIERVMALGAEVDIEHLKWIVLMVLFNRPGADRSFFWIEDLVMNDLSGVVH